MTTTENRAREQALHQYESIKLMLKRVAHIREDNCQEGEYCEIPQSEIWEAVGFWWKEGDGFDEDKTAEYHYEDQAIEAIEEYPLEVSVRDSTWHAPGSEVDPDEYRILLSWGGPACQIRGALGSYEDPITAELQYQDWYEPWETLSEGVEEADLLDFAHYFYYGE